LSKENEGKGEARKMQKKGLEKGSGKEKKPG
jgi:hypothetical protein